MTDIEIKDKWQEYKELLLSTKRPNMDKLVDWLDKNDFKTAPASTRYHDCEPGGLLKHSLQVYYNMLDFNDFIQFFDIPTESVIIMALLHDICKVNCYEMSYRNVKNAQGQWEQVPYYLFNEQEPLGHADKSIMIIYELGVNLTKIERACIRNHMGFSEQEFTPRVSSLFSKCPQSLLLYFADMSATYIQGSLDLQDRFRQKLLGDSVSKSISILNNIKDDNTININGTIYTLAKSTEPVNNVDVIYISDGDLRVKVYSPNKDGLPF